MKANIILLLSTSKIEMTSYNFKVAQKVLSSTLNKKPILWVVSLVVKIVLAASNDLNRKILFKFFFGFVFLILRFFNFFFNFFFYSLEMSVFL